MTSIEYDLLYEKIVDYGNRLTRISEKVYNENKENQVNDDIQKLRLEIFGLGDMLRNARYAKS